MSKGVVVLSGGMDSTVLAYICREQVDDLICVSFDYGQRHRKELTYARITASKLGAVHYIIPMSWLAQTFSSAGSQSSLVNPSVDVPDGHYAEDSMKQTVVPNRNMIMLSIACGVAVSSGAWVVGTGIHAGDHAIYPDCRRPFIEALDIAMVRGNEGFIDKNFHLWTPFLSRTKDQIATKGEQLNVPWEDTWSCYKGLSQHCGTCGTCVERKEAFQLADIKDPTGYLA